jgi:uncharacterized protein YggE
MKLIPVYRAPLRLSVGSGVFAALFAAALLPSNSKAEIPHRPHLLRRAISVTGECLARVAQDRGAVTVTSSVVAKTPQEASSKTIAAHEAIKNEVKRLSLRDGSTETVVYSVFEECSYDGSRRSCTGFRARLASRFETSDIARIGEVIGVASRLGAEEVSNLQTLVSPELMKREREGCLEQATRNAASKAAKLAAGAGVSLGRVRSIEEGVASREGWPVAREFAPRALTAMADSESEASVEAKPVDISVTVSVVYDIGLFGRN